MHYNYIIGLDNTAEKAFWMYPWQQ